MKQVTYYHPITLSLEDKLYDEIVKDYKTWWEWTLAVNAELKDVKIKVRDLVIDWVTVYN